MDGSARHDGRYRMLINQLRVTVTAQKHTKVVEPGHDALQFDAVDEEDCKGSFALSDVIEKGVLKVLSAVCGHFLCLFFLPLPGPLIRAAVEISAVTNERQACRTSRDSGAANIV